MKIWKMYRYIANGHRALDKKEDTVVIWAGTNDISKNCANEALREIENFVSKNVNTNIVVVAAPHRYDLATWSCVNYEVNTFNRKLKKRLKIRNHTKLERAHFTRHGLHLNKHGKTIVCEKLSSAIKLRSQAKHDVIPLKYEVTEEVHQETDPNSLSAESTKERAEDLSLPVDLCQKRRRKSYSRKFVYLEGSEELLRT